MTHPHHPIPHHPIPDHTIMARARSGGARAVLAALLATTSGTALAQSKEVPIPSAREVIDGNGVKLTDGSLAVTSTDLVIGTGDAALAHSRRFVRSGWRHGFEAAISTIGTGSGLVYAVTIGGDTASFTSGFASIEHDGGTLGYDAAAKLYTYTGADGTVTVFDTAPIHGTGQDERAASYYGKVVAVATRITRPDRTVYELVYRSGSYVVTMHDDKRGDYPVRAYVLRLQSVTSSLGFQLKYGYAANATVDIDDASGDGAANDAWYRITTVTAINDAVEYCDPAADACAGLTQAWQAVSYGANDDGSSGETVTDALGRKTRYGYDAQGRITRIKPPRAAATSYGYDANGRIASVATAAGSTGYAWSPSGATMSVTVTDPLQHAQTIDSDTGLGVVTRQRDALGRVTTFGHDANGVLTGIVSPTGVRTVLTPDDRGNVTHVQVIPVAKSGQTTPAAIDTYASYPACTAGNAVVCNQPASTTDARGNVTDYRYDPVHGGVTQVTLPAPTAGAVRPETRYTYQPLSAYYRNASGALVAGAPVYRLTGSSRCATQAACAGSADEIVSAVEYGAANQPDNLFVTRVSSGAGDGSLSAASAFGYDARGDLTSVDGPLAGADDVTTMVYDAARQLVETVGPDPDGSGPLKRRAVKVTRNADGQVEASAAGTDSDPGNAFVALETSVTGYDAMGRRTSEQLQMGAATYATTLYGYDAASRLVCVVEKLNALDDLAATQCGSGAGAGGSDGQDRVTLYSYTDADEPWQVKAAQGTAQAQVTQALAYGDNGEVSSVTDANGNVTAYGYDGFERPWRTSYPSAADGQPSASDYEELGYDAGSNVTSLRVRDGKTIGFAYDALNRRIQKNRPLDTPGETNVAYQYDNLDRLTEAHDSRGWSVGRVYDALGRLTEESAPAPFGSIYWSYDAAGRETSIAWPGGFHVDYDRLVTGEIAAVRENGAGAGVGVLASYGYDDLGRRTGITRGNGTTTSYGYAGTPWLASLGQDLAGSASDLTRTFTRDATGAIRTAQGSNDGYVYANRVAATTSYQPDRLNRYATAGGTTLGYDGRGNLTSATAGGTSSSYGYTADNLLATTPGGNLVYDPLDRLLLQGASGTYLRYAGDELVAEQASDGSIKRRYIHGAGPDEPLVWYEGPGAGDRRWLHADERGSIVAVSDGAGNAKTIAAYDEYGNASNPDDANLGRFRYTGQTWLADARAYYYKSRMYSSALGRFYQTDPIGYADSMNLYGYVGNDPVNFTDPMGLRKTPPGSPNDSDSGGRSGFGLFGGCPAGSRCTSTDPAASNAAQQTERVEAGFPSLNSNQIAQVVSCINSTDCVQGVTNGTIDLDHSHIFSIPTYTDPVTGDIVITASKFISDDQKYVLVGAAYYLNPNYQPTFDITLGEAAVIPPLIGAVGAIAAGFVARNVAVEGAAKGYRLYGSGRLGQIRFGEDKLLIRLDINKPITHLNIEGNLFGEHFNFHIPRF